MPEIPQIPQQPAQGIQAVLDLGYIWNPGVANKLIEELNKLLLQGALIKPYEELTSAQQYAACTYENMLYVANEDMPELGEFDPDKWTAIAGKGSELPDQEGHQGEFLTTNGSETSWANVPVPTQLSQLENDMNYIAYDDVVAMVEPVSTALSQEVQDRTNDVANLQSQIDDIDTSAVIFREW